MGSSYCTPCQSVGKNLQDIKHTAKHNVEMPASPRRGKQHEGQRRATLQVKTGGFAIQNFTPTNNGQLEQNWQFEKGQLGQGGFGAVREAKDNRTGRPAAIKIIRKNGKSTKDLHRLQEEIAIMRVLDHPNIIRFIESFEDRRCIYICLEICVGGEMFTRIVEAKSFTEELASHCTKQMLLAINYLHQNRIMHRDLKPENWLLATKEPVTEAPLKLIDFGISKRFTPGVKAKTQAGTPNYVAPEVLAGAYDEKCDIWSLGIIMYVMLVGSFPFKGKKAADVLKKVKEAYVDFGGGRWQNISGEAKGLVKGCLTKAVANRPDAPTALQSDWLKPQLRPDANGRRSSKKRQTVGMIDISGMEAFGRMHQLKRAVLTVIATQLSDAQIQALKEIFLEMDSNLDGTLSVTELKKGLRTAKIVLPADIDRLAEAADSDGSGVIDYTEFLAATLDRKTYHQEDVVWQAFKKFDLDGNGTIDRNELSKVLGDPSVASAMHLSKADQQRLEVLFQHVDSNNDGLIDFDEFFAMVKSSENMDRAVSRDGLNVARMHAADAGTIGIAGADAEDYRFNTADRTRQQVSKEDVGDWVKDGEFAGLRASTLF